MQWKRLIEILCINSWHRLQSCSHCSKYRLQSCSHANVKTKLQSTSKKLQLTSKKNMTASPTWKPLNSQRANAKPPYSNPTVSCITKTSSLQLSLLLVRLQQLRCRRLELPCSPAALQPHGIRLPPSQWGGSVSGGPRWGHIHRLRDTPTAEEPSPREWGRIHTGSVWFTPEVCGSHRMCVRFTLEVCWIHTYCMWFTLNLLGLNLMDSQQMCLVHTHDVCVSHLLVSHQMCVVHTGCVRRTPGFCPCRQPHEVLLLLAIRHWLVQGRNSLRSQPHFECSVRCCVSVQVNQYFQWCFFLTKFTVFTRRCPCVRFFVFGFCWDKTRLVFGSQTVTHPVWAVQASDAASQVTSQRADGDVTHSASSRQVRQTQNVDVWVNVCVAFHPAGTNTPQSQCEIFCLLNFKKVNKGSRILNINKQANILQFLKRNCVLFFILSGVLVCSVSCRVRLYVYVYA